MLIASSVSSSASLDTTNWTCPKNMKTAPKVLLRTSHGKMTTRFLYRKVAILLKALKAFGPHSHSFFIRPVTVSWFSLLSYYKVLDSCVWSLIALWIAARQSAKSFYDTKETYLRFFEIVPQLELYNLQQCSFTLAWCFHVVALIDETISDHPTLESVHMEAFEAVNKSLTSASHEKLGGTNILGIASGRRPKVFLLM